MKMITLTQGKVALVNDEDYERVVALGPWFPHRNVRKFGVLWYAKRNPYKGERRRFLHRILMDAPFGLVVDHEDENGLNCQRSNMKLSTNADNIRRQPHKTGRGSSKFKGVHFERSRNKWSAQVMVNRRTIHLGRFETEEEAGSARRAFDEKAAT